jgi:hypothetical protein
MYPTMANELIDRWWRYLGHMESRRTGYGHGVVFYGTSPGTLPRALDRCLDRGKVDMEVNFILIESGW